MLRTFNEKGYDDNGFNRDGYNSEGHYDLCHDSKFMKPIPGQMSLFQGEDIPMR